MKTVMRALAVAALLSFSLGSQARPSGPLYTERSVNVQHTDAAGTSEGGVRIAEPTFGYGFCKLNVQVDPRTSTSRNEAGYELAVSNQNDLEWRWWTSAQTGPATFNATFSVTFVDLSLSSADRLKLGCSTQPLPEQIYPLPGAVTRLPISTPGLAALPGSNPLVLSTSGNFHETVMWNEGRIVKNVTVNSPNNDQYFFCRYQVNEETRSPRDEPPNQSGKAGYRLVRADNAAFQWQAWVDQDGHLWGPDNWLTVNFTVVWIRKDALPEHLQAEGCTASPPIEPPYQWHDNPGTGPIGHPERKFVVLMRHQCIDDITNSIEGSSDLQQISTQSCLDARQQVEAIDAASDLCTHPYGSHVTWPHRHVYGSPDWRWTNSCPTAGR